MPDKEVWNGININIHYSIDCVAVRDAEFGRAVFEASRKSKGCKNGPVS